MPPKKGDKKGAPETAVVAEVVDVNTDLERVFPLWETVENEIKTGGGNVLGYAGCVHCAPVLL